MDFAAKTSQWIAYECYIESSLADDRLFRDPIAQHLYEPYGRRMSDAFAFGLQHAVFDQPGGANIGIGMEGHVQYTATCTKLINDALDTWLGAANKGDANTATGGGQQVLNLESFGWIAFRKPNNTGRWTKLQF